MRNLSLRRFKTDIAQLMEPVEVSRRDPDGNIHILGYWTPYAQMGPDPKPLEPLQRAPLDIPVEEPGVPIQLHDDIDVAAIAKVIKTPEEAAAVVPSNPVRAVPKPSQQRKRR